MATKAWKTIQGSGDLQGQLSKVIQGPNEAYADLVARLMQTAGRIFGEVEAAMPLIKQLAYEQANKWCKEAIRPWKSKDLSTYIKVCRDINDSVIQGQVMAAAITQGLQGFQGAQQYKHKVLLEFAITARSQDTLSVSAPRERCPIKSLKNQVSAQDVGRVPTGHMNVAQ